MFYSNKSHWYTTQYYFILSVWPFPKNKGDTEEIWNSSSACQKEISVLFQSSALFRISVILYLLPTVERVVKETDLLLIHLRDILIVILQSSTTSKRTQNREIFLCPDVFYAWPGNKSRPEKVMPTPTIPPKYYSCSVKQSVSCREVHGIKSEIARNTD